MSYEIEYTKKAYRSKDKYGNEAFLAYVTTCSNNVDPRTPRPMFFGAGQGWEIIGRACEFAGSCESGTWQPKNRRVSPESYIRRWRQVLKDATSLECLYGRLWFELTLKREALKNYLEQEPTIANPDHYRWGMIKAHLQNLPQTKSHMYNEDYTCVGILVRTYADVERAVELNGHLKEVNLLAWNMEIKL